MFVCCAKTRYRVLSELRVTMIAYERVLRGTKNKSDPEYFWVSGGMQTTPPPSLLHLDSDLLTNADVSKRGRAAYI